MSDPIRTVKLALVHDQFVDVPAVVFGNWAAHGAMPHGEDEEPIPRSDVWALTYVPSGRCACNATGRLSVLQAIAIAQELNKRLPSYDWRCPTWGVADLIRDVAVDAKRRMP
jgi:hypothetical protein